MGTKLEEQMMGQLERRAEAISGEFDSQEVANTLWAFSVFLINFFMIEHILFNLHRFFMSCDIIEGLACMRICLSVYRP